MFSLLNQTFIIISITNRCVCWADYIVCWIEICWKKMWRTDNLNRSESENPASVQISVVSKDYRTKCNFSSYVTLSYFFFFFLINLSFYSVFESEQERNTIDNSWWSIFECCISFELWFRRGKWHIFPHPVLVVQLFTTRMSANLLLNPNIFFYPKPMCT